MLLKQHVRFGFSQNFLARVRRFLFERVCTWSLSAGSVCKKRNRQKGNFPLSFYWARRHFLSRRLSQVE